MSPKTPRPKYFANEPAAVCETRIVPFEEAIQRLKEGNVRFFEGRPEHPRMDIERVKETARLGQNPFVAILSCSDSRVPMEKVFDQGIGDIFSVRIAGNVCDTMAIGSMEYAVRYAGTRLCVILGHTRCGAVTAVCSYRKSICESVDMLMRAILPAVRRVENATGKKGKEITDFACKENVFVQIEALFGSSSTLRKAVRKKEIMIIGALYDTETGRVDFMGPHPKNKQLAEEPIGEMQSGNL